jgi:hypothetical protein
MKYCRPTANIVGNVHYIIQFFGKGVGGVIEFSTPTWTLDPGYDLDE